MKSAASALTVCLWIVIAGTALRAAEPEPVIDLPQTIQAAATYESGQNAEPLRRLEEAVRQSAHDPRIQKEVEGGLIQLLRPAAYYEAKKFACEQLAVIGSDAALPAISKLLEDPKTVSIACFALSTYPPGKADAALRNALQWPDFAGRMQLINALGDRRDPHAVNSLSSIAEGTDIPLAEAAIGALGKIGTPAAWKVIAALDGKSRPALTGVLAEAQLSAADGIAASGDLKRAKALYEQLLERSTIPAVRRSALAALFPLDRDQGEDRIIETLTGTDTVLKPVAIAAMSHVNSPGAVEKFSAQIHHLKPEEQALLVKSLARRDDDSARLTLAKALSSPDSVVRRAAIVALGEIGDPYFASLIARSASLASDPEENRAIEIALAGLKGGAETDQRLIAELKTSSTKPRIQFIAALARRQGATANPVLLEEVDNTDPAVAKAAWRALGKTALATNAPQILLKLASARDAGVRTEAESTAAQVLAKVEPASQRSTLVRESLAKASTPETRAAFIALLPTGADAPALAALKEAAADPEPAIREAATRALADWPDASAREPLLALYRQPESAAVHGLALRGLVRLASDEPASEAPQVVDLYRQLIGAARNETDLKQILGALAGFGHAEALPLALPLLSNPAVRPEAIVAVKKIAEAIKAQNPQLADEALKRLPNQ